MLSNASKPSVNGGLVDSCRIIVLIFDNEMITTLCHTYTTSRKLFQQVSSCS